MVNKDSRYKHRIHVWNALPSKEVVCLA